MAREGDFLWVQREQMGTHPIDGGGVISAEKECEGERVGGEGAVALAGYDCVGDVENEALNLVAHGAVRTAVEENAIQVEAGSPHGVIAGPRTVGAKVVAEAAGGAGENSGGKTQELAGYARGRNVLPVAHVFERTLHGAVAGIVVAPTL